MTPADRRTLADAVALLAESERLIIATRANCDTYREMLQVSLRQLAEAHRDVTARDETIAALRAEIRQRGDTWQPWEETET